MDPTCLACPNGCASCLYNFASLKVECNSCITNYDLNTEKKLCNPKTVTCLTDEALVYNELTGYVC